MEIVMTLYTIYDKPVDFPDYFVVRKFFIIRGSKEPEPAEMPFAFADTLEDIRKKIPPGLFCFPRDESDSPRIVETWM